MKKSILFKIWKFPQLSETFIVNQVVLAIKMGYEVNILVEEVPDIKGNSNIKLFEKYKLQDKIIIEDYKIPSNKIKRIFKAVWTIIMNLSLFHYLIKYYQNSNKRGLIPLYEFFFYKDFRNFDVIHIQFGTNKHPVDILKKISYLKSRVVVSFHGHDLHFPINNLIPNNGYYSLLFETSDYLIANTAYLKKKLLAIDAPEEKIKIVPVPVDTSIFVPSGRKNQNKILRLVTLGRLDELKGQKHGIQAVNLLVKNGFSVEYTIAGTGESENELKILIEELNLTRYVFLKGKISPSDVPQLFQESDIFLMTSVTNSKGMEESQGLVTAEAQACGLPVIAFDSGGVKYTLIDGKTGFLCKEKDIDCYAAKIELILKNNSLRNEMGLNAYHFIQKEYSENSISTTWRSIYG